MMLYEEHQDPAILQAIREIKSAYGDKVSVVQKAKSLAKFGRTRNADNGNRTTVAVFQDAEINETFATGNTVDYVVSSSASDTGAVTIEGHTLTDGEFTFVVQTVTLAGQTPVALTTPLARVARAYVTPGTAGSPASALVGDVYVYDATVAGGLTSNKPTDATATKLVIEGSAALNQTEKCATTLSSRDYWIITEVAASCARGSASTVTADVDVEYKVVGGVWRPLGLELAVKSSAAPALQAFKTALIVPKNSDVRMVATSNTNDTTITGDIRGVLAIVMG